MLRSSLRKQLWIGLLVLVVANWLVGLPSSGRLGPDVVYAEDGDDFDLPLFIVPILAARPSLQVLAPNGGESLTAGSWYDITWQGTASIKEVDIEFSLDSGLTYPIAVAKKTPNDRTYTWGPVPFHDPLKLSGSCKIRIRDSEHPSTVLDESDGVFSIENAAAPMTLGPLEAMNNVLANDPDGVEKDSDGDGLYDNVETYLGTDPLNWDSDRDGFDDYWEVFGDVSDVPVPDGDGDSKIAPLDNDDNGDGRNDGRDLDSDSDGIPDYLETYGFVYISTAPLRYYPWNEDIWEDYYKTNPQQSSTDQDQYSDSLEVTKTNMDLTVASPGDNPMMAAFPNFVVKLTDYTVELNSTITETDGTVHTDSSTWNHTIEESTSVTDEWHWDFGIGIFASFLDFGASVNASYGESHSTTHTNGTARSQGGEMSNAVEWSQATSTNPSEAAKIKLNLEVQNVGTCVSQNVRITLNLQLAGKNIATLTHPVAPDTIPRLIVAESYSWVSDWVMLTFEELRALRTGAPVTIEMASVSADVVRREGDTYVYVNDWGLYFTAAENASAHLFLDLGDGHTTEHLVYAGEADWEPVVTLKDALIWAANGYETEQGPFVRFYQPDGTLGDPAPLDGWYFSMDQSTYDGISSYMQSPGFNFFDTVLSPDSVIVAKAPPIHPTPKIHWAVLSPRDGKVTAYVDDYFFSQSLLTVHFVDKNGSWHRMTWDEAKLYFSWACPDDYFKDGTEKIVARNPMYATSPTPADWETTLPAGEMVYVPGFWHPYTVGSYTADDFKATYLDVFGDYAYVLNLAYVDGSYIKDLRILDISDPQSPVLNGTCDTCIAGTATDIQVSGDYAYVTGYSMGLVIVDVSDKTQPVLKGSVEFVDHDYGWDSNPRSVFVEYPYAYVVAQMAGFNVVDVSDPMQPLVVGQWDPPGVYDMWGQAFVSGSYAFIADPHHTFDVVDISAKNSPNRVGYITTSGTPNDVVAVGDYAYVASGSSGLQVIDVSSKLYPEVYGSLPNPGGYTDYWWVRVSGDYAFLAGPSALAVIDIKDSAHPSLAGLTTEYKTNGYDSNFDLFGDYVCIGNGEGSLQIVGFK